MLAGVTVMTCIIVLLAVQYDDNILSAEEEDVARFWEQEELETQQRWDQQEEIDYSEIARLHQTTSKN